MTPDKPCPHCQTLNRPEARFCMRCGVTLNGDDAPATVVLPATPAVDKGVRLRYGFQTDIGQVREVNEDSLIAICLAGLFENYNQANVGLFAVADGVGGQEAGETASRVALHRLMRDIMDRVFKLFATHNETEQQERLIDRALNPTKLEQKLKETIQAANRDLHLMRQERGNDMGTTLTAALCLNDQAIIANVGDSRTYLWREGQLEQKTIDHSLLAALRTAGEVTDENEAAYRHQKGVIYRSLGDRPEIAVDTYIQSLQAGDRLILCSDGIWEMVPETTLINLLTQFSDPQPLCNELVRQANQAGGKDNMSVIVVVVEKQ